MYFGELSTLMKYVILLSESLLVVVLAILFYLLIHKTKFGKLKWIHQQIIIGVIFGGAAIFGTELGVDTGTSIINVRDAAPVTAGLLFGGPAGMIAAFIGSLWRMISTLAFSKAEYAMVACCVATLLAGVYAWVLRKWFFEEKTPNFLFGFATAAIMEVLHFIILYLTHIKEPEDVLSIIYEITVVMIIANGVGVSLACLAVGLLENGFSLKIFKSSEKTINSRIQLHLLILILVTAYMSTSFVTIIQRNYANETANEALDNNIFDLSTYINEQTNSEMEITTAYAGKEFVKSTDPDLNQRLQTIKETYPQITHMNVVAFADEDGHKAGDILYSTEASSIGKNEAGFDVDDLMTISYNVMSYNITDNEGKIIFPRRYIQTFYDSDFYQEEVKIGSISLHDLGGMNAFLQVFSNVEDFYTKDYGYLGGPAEEDINGIINELTKHRRVYLSGFMIVLDRNGNIVSYYQEGEGITPINFSINDVGYEHGFEVYQTYDKKISGVDSFYSYDTCEKYYVVSVIPKRDVTDGRNMMIIVYSFMLIFIYASIFFVTYILMKQLVIKNLRKINHTLNLIMQGDLDQKVDVKSSQEFIDLSRDINITVDTLKDFIKEAEERIDKELAFARTIQASSLPSVFPAFPGVKEFDIFATMNTAKEVGGDFYDFYFVDMNHIAFLVADVSGKGIPASMFMMESKALIKNTLTSTKDIDVVFNRVNESLTQGNDANMFVTCWMGIVDLTTGVVEFVNAGHNAPILYRKKTAAWTYLTEAKDLVLAGLANTKYHKQVLKLNPGDKIYLYTDGVTEATRGDKTLYGEERLLNYLNKQKTFDQYKLLAGIQKDIDKFVAGADQFDDITMLVFDFKQLMK